MKLKIVGFKVRKARPTFNRTVDIGYFRSTVCYSTIGEAIVKAFEKDRSNFASVRVVD